MAISTALARTVCPKCGDGHVCVDNESIKTPISEEEISEGGIVINRAFRTATFNGTYLPLRPREFDVLFTLVQAGGRVLTRPYLLDTVWPAALSIGERTVDVHVRRIRTHLERIDPKQRRNSLIRKVHGIGYCFNPNLNP